MIILIFVLGLIFVRRVQPIFIIGRLILLVIIYSYFIYIYIGIYWFGYALVIVILRGVLVVFTYIVSLIPNENFERYNIVYILILIILMMGGYKVWKYDIKWIFISLELWNSCISIINIFIVRFLLIIILMVVWLSYIGYGAIRGE